MRTDKAKEQRQTDVDARLTEQTINEGGTFTNNRRPTG